MNITQTSRNNPVKRYTNHQISLTAEELAQFRRFRIPTASNTYTLLTIAKMYKGYVTLEQMSHISPTKLSKSKRIYETIRRLKTMGFAESHPDKCTTIRITEKGLKYIYYKSTLGR